MDKASFLQHVQGRLRRLLRVRGQTPDDADDLIQEALLRLHVYYERGGEVREPEAFLVRTVLRLSINAHRDEHRELFISEPVEDLPLPDLGPAPEELLAADQYVERIRRTLDGISQRTREIFFLHRIDGLSYGQIARLYGMTTKAVERRIAHAMLTLSIKMPPE